MKKIDYQPSVRRTLFGLSIYLIFLILLSCGGSGGDGNSGTEQVTVASTVATSWAKAYGGRGQERARSIQQTDDGGFIVAGESSSFGAGNTDIWLFKLDSGGNIQWQRTYGGSGYDLARSLQQTADGGFVVAGETSSFGTSTDIWILKLSPGGNIEWQKTYGGSGVDSAQAIQQTPEGGFIVVGETTSFGAAGTDFWVLKLKGNGDIEWQKTLGGSEDDYGRAVQTTADGGYILAGETLSFGAGDMDIWVLKLRSNGDIEWQKTYSGAGTDDVAYSIQQTSEGGYILAGGSTSLGGVVGEATVLKLRANGDIEWWKNYGGVNDDVAYAIRQSADGGYMVAGGSSSLGHPLGDLWVFKLRADGDIQWQKAYGGKTSNSGGSIRQTLDGGYIVAGETSSYGTGNSDSWILKLDGNGSIAGTCSIGSEARATITSAAGTLQNSTVSGVGTNALPASTLVSPADSAASPTAQCSSS